MSEALVAIQLLTSTLSVKHHCPGKAPPIATKASGTKEEGDFWDRPGEESLFPWKCIIIGMLGKGMGIGNTHCVQ